MLFFHLGFGMGNGQAYSQILGLKKRRRKKCNSLLLGLGMGMKNQIPSYWNWEWEWKINSQHLGLGNASHFQENVNATGNSMLSLHSSANSCFLFTKFNLNCFLWKRVLFSPIYFLEVWDLEWELKTLFPNFENGKGNEKQCSQLLGLRMGMKNIVSNQSWEIID